MECIYYSAYPYKAKDFKKVDAAKHGCKWRGTAYQMPFRLYKAAICETTNVFTEVEFVKQLWEVLDMPNYKGIEDITKKFTLDGIEVTPLEHFYGATNSNDGVYVINDHFYTIGMGGVKRHISWEDAFDWVFQEKGRTYLCGKDYTREN